MNANQPLRLMVWMAAALIAIGALTGTLATGSLARFGIGALVAGILATVAAMAWGHTIDAPPVNDDARAAALQRAFRLKSGTLLLALLAVTGFTILAAAVLSRLHMIQIDVDTPFLRRGVLVLTAFGGLAHAFVHSEALVQSRERDRGPVRTIMFVLASGLAALAAILLALLTADRADVLRPAGISAADSGILRIALLPLLAVALYASRSLPGLPEILGQDRALRGGVGVSGRRVLMPVLMAFGMLFLSFLLFLVFGAGGVLGLVDQVSHSPLLLGVIIFLLLAMLGSIGLTFSLARTEPLETPLFLVPVDSKVHRQRIILVGSLVPAGLLMAFSAVLFSGQTIAGLGPETWIHFFCAGLLLGLGPFGFYSAFEHRRIRQLEERFPDFLRDVASSHKGGLTLANAVAIAARGEYGPLTPEIRRMADQLTWNVSFNEALERFAEHVQTPLVQRAVNLILQANKSGGATTEVLLAAARDAREIKSLENERRLSMSLYTVVIYVTFLVFLGVAAIMYAKFVPQLVNASNAAAQQAATAGVQNISGSTGAIKLRDFQLFYFMAAIMQGLGDGIVAGMMGNGKAVLGLRHSFLMVVLSYVTFVLFLG